MRIVFGVREYDDYFMCKKDYTRLWGFSSVPKYYYPACIAYGAPRDMTNDYLCMSDSKCFKSITCFVWQLWRCLDKPICDNQMNKTMLESFGVRCK
jgi:hypothetical protein